MAGESDPSETEDKKTSEGENAERSGQESDGSTGDQAVTGAIRKKMSRAEMGPIIRWVSTWADIKANDNPPPREINAGREVFRTELEALGISESEIITKAPQLHAQLFAKEAVQKMNRDEISTLLGSTIEEILTEKKIEIV